MKMFIHQNNSGSEKRNKHLTNLTIQRVQNVGTQRLHNILNNVVWY